MPLHALSHKTTASIILYLKTKQKDNEVSADRLPTQRMRDEVEEGVAQQAARGKAEQHLEQVLVLGAVGLDWDQEQDEERSGTDQQGRSDGLQRDRRMFITDTPLGGERRGKAQLVSTNISDMLLSCMYVTV